jgi:hypothetical protein
MNCFHNTKFRILTFNLLHVCMYWFLQNWPIKSLVFEDLSARKISWSRVDWWKFGIHLRSLVVRCFRTIEGKGRRAHCLYHDLPTEFYRHLLIGPVVIMEGWYGQTETIFIS